MKSIEVVKLLDWHQSNGGDNWVFKWNEKVCQWWSRSL